MPKGTIYKVEVNKKIFMWVLKQCNSSIIKLGECDDIECTERTIRRALNEGKITPCYLEQIAKHLDVDPRFLSGELHKKALACKDDFLRKVALYNLRLDRYPYFKKRQDDLKKQSVSDLIEKILSLFDISFSQFEDMDFEAQYLFQHDLLDAITSVIGKHFNVDGYGREGLPNLGSIVNSLENYKEDYYERLYAEEVLRKKFLENLPFGKTKAEIKKMSADALIELDMDMTYEENDRFKDRQY